MTAETLTVATIALEKVIEGDLDEARELIGQLPSGDRQELFRHWGTLYGITLSAIYPSWSEPEGALP